MALPKASRIDSDTARALPARRPIDLGVGALAVSVIAGVALRLDHYLTGRALWFDEYMLALNIFNRSYAGLLEPLDHNQGAPLGFLWLEKFAVTALGPSEAALRLFPLLAGLLALFLFVALARRYADRTTALVATIFFSLTYPLVYYSAETKQYSFDVFVTITLLLVGHYLETWRSRRWAGCLYGLIGACAVWLSHAAVFVLVGLLAADLWQIARQRGWRRLEWVLLPVLFWLPSFCIVYMLSLANLSHNQDLLAYWDDSFIPLLPRSWEDLRTIGRIAVGVFALPLGLTLPLTATIGLARGVWAWRGEARLLRLLLPIGAVAAASALHVYPFRGRLILFLAPLLFMLIAAGLIALWHDGGKHWTLLLPTLALAAHPVWLTTTSRLWPDTWSPACVQSRWGLWIDISLASALGVGLLLAHRSRIARGLQVVLLGGGLAFLGIDLAQALLQPQATCFMPDWRRVALTIRAYHQPGEPVVITGWDAIPLQRYLGGLPLLLGFQLEEQLVAGTSSGSYLLVYSQFSSLLPTVAPHEVEIATPAPTVRLTRYTP